MLSFFRPLLRLLPLSVLCLCALTLFGLAAPRCAAATNYFVSPIGNDTNPGTLAAPFLTIQYGINTASSGDTVTVEDGTYTGPGNVDLDFGGRNITVTSQNGATKTIIDCGGITANHRGFDLHSNETNAVISSLTIENGSAYNDKGGGIFLSNVGAIVRDCIIRDSSATYEYGGGVYISIRSSSVSVSLTNCIITNNTAFAGGGIYMSNYSGIGSIVLSGCTINNNATSSHGFGGGIYSSNSGNNNGPTRITNCNISNNYSDEGGGVYNIVSGNSAVTFTSCDVVSNSAFYGSGTYNDFINGGYIAFINDILYDGGDEIGYSKGVPTTQYCNVQGGYAGTGNINVDPAFVNSPTDLHLKNFSLCLGAGTASGAPITDITGATRPNPPSIGAYEAAVPVPGSDDFFVVTSENSGSNTVGEYTPTGSYVRTITVPANTTAANSGVGVLRGIAATDAGQIVGFNGTFGPELTTYNPAALTFTSQTAPGWEIGNNGSSGSVGVYQGYAFVVNEGPDLNTEHTAIIRFNPDGTSQQFADNLGYTTPYINLAVGMDGKLYALRLNLAGSQTSAWALDVYDAISLALLRTINLQLPYTQNSQSVDLRNFAVDAHGGIYAIELYNNVYHFDTNGNLLQSASHGQGGYTNDIKIDPVSGNLLISIDSYPQVIIKTDPLLSSFQTLVTVYPKQFGASFMTFSNAKLAAALIGPPRLTATAGPGSVSLQWTDPAGIASATYSVYRGTTSGGETLYQSGITTNYADTAVTPGTTYYYTVRTITASQTSAASNEASATPLAILGKVRYFPRIGQEIRMVGGLFQGSHDNATWTTLATVTAKPTDVWTEAAVAADPKTFRFLRYLSPTGSYGNVAEIEFYTGVGTSVVKLTGTPFGTAGSYKNNGFVYTNALDGNTSTFFDAPAPGNGDYLGIDQGPPVGSLSGSSAAITASQPINLTTLGTADWAHWGLNGVHGSTPGEFDHKAGLISNYTAIGTGTVVSYPTTFINCTWTGGTPTASATTSSEVYLKNNGSGFGLTIPADTTRRTLTLYVGGYNSTATLTAHLSDGSAVDFVDASYGSNKPGSTDGAHYQGVYTLTYTASSAGQTLTVSWVQTTSLNSSGNVTLQAAALALTPP